MFTTPLGVRPDQLGNGTSPRDMRHALAGLVTGPGVLSGLTVAGHTLEWTYAVAPGYYAAERPDNGGIILGANDAEELVGTIPAPGTGSRIDIIYIQTQEEETSAEAYPWVANGTASGTPVAPSLPVGAMEIARKVVAAGDTNTAAGAPVTYSNTKRAYLRGVTPPSAWTEYTRPAGWTAPTYPATRVHGDMVELRGATMTRVSGQDLSVSAGVAVTFGSIPVAHAPAADTWLPSYVRYGAGGSASAAMVIVRTTGALDFMAQAGGTLAGSSASSAFLVPYAKWPVK